MTPETAELRRLLIRTLEAIDCVNGTPERKLLEGWVCEAHIFPAGTFVTGGRMIPMREVLS
jgi:hypothetical protein